jgi:hypothetical protein
MRILSALVSLPLKLTLGIAGRAASALGLTGDDGHDATVVRVPPQPERFRTPARPRRPGGNGGAPPAAPEREPVHVSEEPELVVEVADKGAEEGAGAEVRVDEPWEGYDRMTAAAIRGRLRMEGTAVAAAVRLYEASHKGRSSVLEEAGRRTSARPSG